MILGIDIGGTKCAAALGTAAGEIAARADMRLEMRSEMETRAAVCPGSSPRLAAT